MTNFSMKIQQRAKFVAAAALLAVGASADAAKLDVADGVVVKFGTDASLVVRRELSTGDGVVFTSVKDDAAAGMTGPAAASPLPGDWRGVKVETTVAANALRIDGLELRYAGGGGMAALDIALNYTLRALRLVSNTTGIRVGGGTPNLAQIAFANNATGLRANGATPVVTASTFTGNAFGVFNETPASVVSARGNWWGHASGPTDAQGNPGGSGDAVSPGVDYGQFLTSEPLVGCTVDVADGVYTRATRNVPLVLTCENATEMRLTSAADFGDAPYVPMDATAMFDVGATAGTYSIRAQFRSAAGATVIVAVPQPVVYAPGLPVVTITAPDENAVLVADATFAVTASDAAGIAEVEFHVGTRLIGTDAKEPYEATIDIDAFTHGVYVLRAVVRNTNGHAAEATRSVRIGAIVVDTDPPVLADIAFGGVTLSTSGTTITAPGSLTFATSDALTSVTAASAKIDGQTLSGATFDGARYAAFVSFDAIANGAHTLVLDATDAAGNTASATYPITVDLPLPSAPVIVSPTDGTVGQATVAVSGTAQPGSKVQLFLNGSASGPQLAVGANGTFGASVQLPGEGGHTIHATATTSRGTSPASVSVLVNYVVPPPTLLITSPADTAVLANDTDINASVIDPAGVASVAFAINGTVVHTATQPPYTHRWLLANVTDGEYTIAVTATSTTGKTATATRIVFVEKTPPIPEPPQTPYTGQVQTATPASSYGEQDVVITGRAIARVGGAAMPNSLVRLVLAVGGFQRKINVVTDADGAFRFTFKPQASDAGVYGVSANHPDEPIKPAEQTFTITRLNIAPTSYLLNAARTVSTPVRINVSSSAGAGVTGFRFAVEPEDQPNGPGLPNGISVSVPPAQNVPANGSVAVEVRFLAALNSGEKGAVVLTAYANDSGNAKRAKVRIDYNLRDPQPALSPTPTSISTGAKLGQQVTETLTLKNSGALPAAGVTATLVAAPAWVTLGVAQQLGDIGIGETKTIPLLVTPPAGLDYGVYRFHVRVASSNTQAGDIPVSVAVTDAQTGSVAFQVEDIYTDPRGTRGAPVFGVAGASVRVQHENVLTLVQGGTTDANGRVRIDGLSIGNYVYRVSAPNHADATGRILVKPVGANGTEPTLETVFLDYELVSFEWSVTETTIQDRYDVTLNATYHTNVPAPVVVIEPASINIPDLQQGEEFTGEFTITNYGLIRADNVRFTRPVGNDALDVAFFGDVPSSLAARQRVTIGYRIAAKQAFPGDAIQLGSNQSPVKRAPLLGGSAKEGGCNAMRLLSLLKFDYECVNGTLQTGASAGSFDKIWGDCGVDVDLVYVPPGDHDGGGWPGGYHGPAGVSINPPGIPCVSLCLSFCCAVEKWFPGASEGKAGITPGVLPAGPFPFF